MATATKASSKTTKAKSAETTTKAATKAASKSAAKAAETAKEAQKALAKTAVAKASGEKSATKAKKAAPVTLTPEQRRCYVEVAAYYIAERRGFHGGSELDDWLQAEAEIDRLLQEGVLKP